MDLGSSGVWCILCGAKICAMDVLIVQRLRQEGNCIDKEGRPMFDESKCVYCGDCIRGWACPTDAWKRQEKGVGWCVPAGNMERHPRVADLVANFFCRIARVNDFISATLKWYKENGKTKERIGTVIDRVGLDKFKKKKLQVHSDNKKEWNNCINIKNHDDEGQKKFVMVALAAHMISCIRPLLWPLQPPRWEETYIFLFFWALRRFVNDEFDVKKLSDEFGEEGGRLSKRMQEINPVSQRNT